MDGDIIQVAFTIEEFNRIFDSIPCSCDLAFDSAIDELIHPVQYLKRIEEDYSI